MDPSVLSKVRRIVASQTTQAILLMCTLEQRQVEEERGLWVPGSEHLPQML